jgi:hypothetical protein
VDEQVIKIKLEPLRPEAFRPHGQMLENKRPLFPRTPRIHRCIKFPDNLAGGGAMTIKTI